MVETGFKGIGTHITRSQNTVAQYILMRLIMDLCERSAWRPGARVSRRWWEQDGIYMEGAKKSAEVAAYSEGEETLGEG